MKSKIFETTLYGLMFTAAVASANTTTPTDTTAVTITDPDSVDLSVAQEVGWGQIAQLDLAGLCSDGGPISIALDPDNSLAVQERLAVSGTTATFMAPTSSDDPSVAVITPTDSTVTDDQGFVTPALLDVSCSDGLYKRGIAFMYPLPPIYQLTSDTSQCKFHGTMAYTEYVGVLVSSCKTSATWILTSPEYPAAGTARNGTFSAKHNGGTGGLHVYTKFSHDETLTAPCSYIDTLFPKPGASKANVYFYALGVVAGVKPVSLKFVRTWWVYYSDATLTREIARFHDWNLNLSGGLGLELGSGCHSKDDPVAITR